MNPFRGVVLLSVVCFSGVVQAAETPSSQLSESAPQPGIASSIEVALGEPLEWSSPKFPKRALIAKVQGEVKLVLSVSDKGTVTNVSVMSGDPELAQAAEQAARRWKYVPFFRGGKAIPVSTTVTLQFKIGDAGKPEITASYQPRAIGPIFTITNDVVPPKALYAPNPEYSKEARKAGIEGTCVLDIVVGPDGSAHNIRVSRSLGKGLDEEAIEAVKHWKFQPAMKDGQPVAVAAKIEVSFRL